MFPNQTLVSYNLFLESMAKISKDELAGLTEQAKHPDNIITEQKSTVKSLLFSPFSELLNVKSLTHIYQKLSNLQ